MSSAQPVAPKRTRRHYVSDNTAEYVFKLLDQKLAFEIEPPLRVSDPYSTQCESLPELKLLSLTQRDFWCFILFLDLKFQDIFILL